MRIGIDTGGTYTDAVLWDDADGAVLTSAKARTRPELATGVGEAIDRILPAVPGGAGAVTLVSLSTTLATNALVEGIGGPVGLVFIGFGPAEIDRAGLRAALRGGPIVLVDGGHDALGVERAPLDVERLVDEAARLEVDAFAVTAQFSVRNPAHELAAKAALAALGKPVACGHELSARLNGPKRALTCVLSAGLIGLTTELCRATRAILDERGVTAPLMIVRGDGSLVSADFAVERPIETILSGPAASLLGAAHLTGVDDLVAIDIGGTTTDVGLVRRGRPIVSAEGATVGGHRTMVEAVEMVTVGLGGDSEVRLDTRPDGGRVVLGPRRMEPLVALAERQPEVVLGTLRDRDGPHRPEHTTFARAVPRAGAADVTARERALLDRLAGWTPVDRVAGSNLAAAALRSLVTKGLVGLAGFTPTDAAHVLGLQADWDPEPAALAADLVATTPDRTGGPIRPNGKALAQWVVDAVVRRSAETVLVATLAADGLPAGTVDSPLVQRWLDRAEGQTGIRIGPSAPIAGLGAGSATYHPGAARLLDARLLPSHHAPVANAVGAAVGAIRVTGRATVSQPSRGQYRVHLPGAGPDLGDVEPAIARAVELLSARVSDEADAAGAASVELAVDVDRRTATVAGKPVLVEAEVTIVATGPPRVGPPAGPTG